MVQLIQDFEGKFVKASRNGQGPPQMMIQCNVCDIAVNRKSYKRHLQATGHNLMKEIFQKQIDFSVAETWSGAHQKQIMYRAPQYVTCLLKISSHATEEFAFKLKNGRFRCPLLRVLHVWM